MKHAVRLLLTAGLVLGFIACSSQQDAEPEPPEPAPALLAPNDLAKAPLIGRNADLTSLGLGEEVTRITLDALPLGETDAEIQPAPPSARLSVQQEAPSEGFVTYLETDRATYRLMLYDVGASENRLVYEGDVSLQSTSATADGNVVSFTAQLGDNYEVFVLDLGGDVLGEAGALVRVTDTPYDERDVSLSSSIPSVGLFANQLAIAWQGVFQDEELDAEVETVFLGAVNPQNASLNTEPLVFQYGPDLLALLEPNLSGNADQIVFVLEQQGLVRLDFLTGTLNVIYTAQTGQTLGAPSVSDDGTTFAALVEEAEGVSAAIYGEAGTEAPTPIPDAKEHPFLSAGGDALAYSNSDNVYLSDPTGENSRQISDAEGFRAYGATWAREPVSGPALRYEGSNDDGPFVRPPDGELTDEERTVLYDARRFSVEAAGWYEVLSQQGYDGYLNLYRAPFDPEEPVANLVASNDDFIGSGGSSVTAELEADTEYVIVTSACGVSERCGSAEGNFRNSVVPTDPPPPPYALPDPDPARFNITLRFAQDDVTRDLSEAQRAVFAEAAERWSAAITGDLNDVELSLAPLSSVPGTGAVQGTLDDVLIDVKFSDLDGPGGLLGRAGPRITREADSPDGGLPAYGLMEFDVGEFDDFGSFADPEVYKDVIFHEMGHVLGIGVLWEGAGLTEGTESGEDVPSTAPGIPNPDYDPRFTGENAISEYRRVSEEADREPEASVPIANTGEAGNYNGHWREWTFENEIMTPYLSGDERLSRVSVASLGDLGYAVDEDAAETYGLPPLSALRLTVPKEKVYQEVEDYFVASPVPDFEPGRIVLEGTVQAVDINLEGSRVSTSGCVPADFADFEAGNIALLQDGTCDSSFKILNAIESGAAGIILFAQGDTEENLGPITIQMQGPFDGPVLGVSFDVGAELASYDASEVFIDTGGLDADTVEPQGLGQPGSFRIDQAETLLKPTATVAPDGKVKPLD